MPAPPPPTQLGQGDLLASFDDPGPPPHLRMYTGPSAEFASPHPHPHPHPPPRRLSQVFSAAGPSSPPVVSAEAGNAGFILPTPLSPGGGGGDDFGAFKSAPPPPNTHRRLSSFDGLWNLATFPRRSAGTSKEGDHDQRGVGTSPRRSAGTSKEDEHEHDERGGDILHTQNPAPTTDSNSNDSTAWGTDLLRDRRARTANVLGTALKAKSKWKTIRGPASFHPVSSSSPALMDIPGATSGYALHHPYGGSSGGVEDDDPILGGGGQRRPVVITHSSPFLPPPSSSPTSSSLPLFPLGKNPLSGAPGFRTADTWLGSTRPVSQSQEEEAGDAEKRQPQVHMSEWTGTRLVGRQEGTDVVLDQSAADALRPFLPPRQRLSRTWTMLFSTDQHGASLTTFYRLLDAHALKHPQAGNLLVLRDENGRRFGVFMNEPIRRLEGSYTGSGESWLFKLSPSIPSNNGYDDDTDGGGATNPVRAYVYKWTGKNHYFALCESEFISFGGGDGRYGLWIDKSLYHGSSAPCPAYENEVLCEPPGSTREQRATFECYGLEVWATS